MGEEISISELFATLKRHFSKIILWSLAGLIISGVYTFFFVTPQYESTSKIVVNQTQNTGQSITNSDIQTNLNLINTYQSIIREPIILEDVIETTDSNLSVSQLGNKISVQTQNNSLVFGITVSDPSPYEAAELANATATSFEKKIGDILEVESVTILSQAIPDLSAVSPNVPFNMVAGLVLGLMIGVGFAFLSEYLDNTIKGNQFINEHIGWTDLGAISLMTEKELKDMAVRQEEHKIESRRGRRVV
ncbi:Capsular polysaccharide biosynthesis protein [Trichococcus flocculiformis]|uniref:YveK family protein n=1 Tax=Trichococcus TaxID=82802 RepID=UPI0007A7C363|nr:MULTISPECIES: Wzz/FepE/Etk N-terminal domain-containing protein [Trichococcus]CZR11092.1 lipopolysaccharide biosynthesis [Trichococcus sp. ES5]SHG29468.1 Capsular polysaccharide biosynthesis protein [Trichococcus flocculiformis]